MPESDLKSNPTKIKSEGPRFTILQAKSQFGLLEGWNILLNSKNNDRGYHKRTDGTLFQNLVEQEMCAVRQATNICKNGA